MKLISDSHPRITFENTEIFADHEKNGRSGHLGHAMVECKDGSVLAFYANRSAQLPAQYPGHSMYGWVEWRRSFDRGITWTEPKKLDYAWKMFLDGVYKIGCEKAVVCEDGTIVLFCLRSIGSCFEPYASPVCLISRDNGESWSEPVSVSSERGRIYDARYKEGRIYILQCCSPAEKDFYCRDEGCYKIFVSDDCGLSFREHCTLPFDAFGHTYGNLFFRQDGSMVFCAYNQDDQYNLTGLISYDLGLTWTEPFKIPVAKICRNPQVGYLNGSYIMHGRSENMSNFVFYHSADGIHWDQGTIVNEPLNGNPRMGCYYSGNLTLRGSDGIDRLLVQYSEQYESGTGRFNILHGWVTCDPSK